MNCQHKTEGLAALRENFNILTEKGQLLQYKIFRLSPFNVSITHRPFEKKKFYLKNVSDRDGSWTKEKSNPQVSAILHRRYMLSTFYTLEKRSSSLR